MTVSGEIGGVPDLTAMFVIATGIVGAVIGELLFWLPIRSTLARGTLLGVGAHGAGDWAPGGSIAGLVMVLVGLANVMLTPLVLACARAI